jgi:REP element-mobilizing transposase RayT
MEAGRIAGPGQTTKKIVCPTDAGPLWLSDPRIAEVVASALLHGDRALNRYQLHAWVVMPNHVYAILNPSGPMPAVMRWLKGRTARVANRLLERAGTPFWQDESFDCWVRSPDELRYLIGYVEDNPVKAGLVASKE